MANKDYVLSYHDTLIRQQDLKLLDSPNWLNDVIIEFALEYFQREPYRDYSEEFTYIGPSVTQLIKMGDVQVGKSILETMSLQDKRFVLIPLNDQNSFTRIDGTHWSLLVYYPVSKRLEHYDSSSGSANYEHARKFLIRLRAAGLAIDDDPIPCSCTVQNDSYNCGVHLIANAEALLKKHFFNFSESVKELANIDVVYGMRERLRELIKKLAYLSRQQDE